MKGSITIEVLKSVDADITLPAEIRVVPAEFFETRKGFWVSDNAKERFVSKAHPIEAGAEFALESFDLVRYSSDEEIELALENKNIFSESDAAAIVASLIIKQANGEDGPLKTTGDWNLFYTPSCVVHVRWYGDEWYVGAWERVAYDWSGALRVFSPRT